MHFLLLSNCQKSSTFAPKFKIVNRMKKLITNFINHWFDRSVYMAGIVALIAIFVPMSITQKLLLASIAVLFLHFFEEFGSPGGFPYMGVKVLLGKDEKDPKKWNCNNLSSMYGNWLFLFLVYCLPLFFPNLHVLTLAAMMFSFAELLMHLILFNVRLKACYNPGMITGVFMLPPIAIYYFARVFDASMFSWYHYVIAVVWFVFVFWLSFRSPIYWGLGKKPGYEFTEQSAFGMYH